MRHEPTVDGVIERVRRATFEVTGTPAADTARVISRDSANGRSRRALAIVAGGVLVIGAATSLTIAAKRDSSPPISPNPVTTEPTTETTIDSTIDTTMDTTIDTSTASSAGSSTTAPSDVRVSYERVEVVLTSDLMCSNPIDTSGMFASSVIETWIDRINHRARSTVTYPDGSTRDLIAVGSAVYPTLLYGRGEARGARSGCIAPDGEELLLGFEPGTSYVYSLNLEALLTPDEADRFASYDKIATLQPGETTDSRGRTSQLWRHIVSSTDSFDIVTPSIEQTSDTYVSSDTHRITERTFTNTYESLGTATTTETLTDESDLQVPASLFDTNGYTREETPEPDEPLPCVTDPFPPPFMPDGSEVGPIASEHGSFGTSIASWGNATPVKVLQQIGAMLDQTNFFDSVAAGDALSAGTWRAVVTALDETQGVMVIELYNSADQCLRRYQVQPAETFADAIDYAHAWIDALSTE